MGPVALFPAAPLYVLLYALAHAVYAGYWHSLRSWRATQARWRRLRDTLLRRRVTRDSVIRDTHNLRKLPAHLAVILPDAVISQHHALAGLSVDNFHQSTLAEQMNKVNDLVCWSLAAGFEELSLYDADGLLKRETETLQRMINTSAAKFFEGETAPYVRVETSLRSGRKEDVSVAEPTTENGRTSAASRGGLERSSGYSRGNKLCPFDMSAGRRTMRVNLLSREDGKLAVVGAARGFGAAIREKKLSPRDVTPLTLHHHLMGPSHPDPQLLIVFLPRLVLDGFPPWQLRLTEIFHVPGNCNFDYYSFLDGLRSYAACEMRFGR